MVTPSHRAPPMLGPIAAGLGLAVAVAACSIAGLDAYDKGVTGGAAGATGTSTGGAGTGTTTTTDTSPCAGAAGVACVDGPPLGWTGPLAFYEGSPTGEPACPPAFPQVAVDLYESLGAVSPAQCAACACGPPQSGTCSGEATLHLYTDNACNSPCERVPVAAMGCGSATSVTCTNAKALTVSGPMTTATCSPSGGTAQIPQLTWGAVARGCAVPALTARGCPSGQLCAPRPAAPFGAALCIAQTGDIPCPAGSYSQKHTAFAGAADSRACSPCTCASTNVPCGGSLALNPGADCFGPFFLMGSLPIACTAVPSQTQYSMSFSNGSATGGSCPPSGGQPTGTATPMGPVTVCCQP